MSRATWTGSLAMLTVFAACASGKTTGTTPALRPMTERQVLLFQNTPACPFEAIGYVRSEFRKGVRRVAFEAGADAVILVRRIAEEGVYGQEGQAVRFLDPKCRR